MAVSKNRRKNGKTKIKKKQGNKNKMTRLIDEGRDTLLGIIKSIRQAIKAADDAILTFKNAPWRDSVTENEKINANNIIDRYVPLVTEAYEKINRLEASHRTVEARYAEKMITPMDLNWRYIELVQEAYEVVESISYFNESGISQLEGLLEYKQID